MRGTVAAFALLLILWLTTVILTLEMVEKGGTWQLAVVTMAWSPLMAFTWYRSLDE